MKRKDISTILEKFKGQNVEDVTGDLIDAIMVVSRNDINAEKDKLEEAHNVAIENLKKDYEAKYEGYVSKEEHSKVLSQIDELKDASAKESRYSKYRASKLNEKLFGMIDSQLKDSKDFDKDLEKYIKDNPEFILQVQEKKEEPSKKQGYAFGGQDKSQNDNKSASISMESAMYDYYSQK